MPQQPRRRYEQRDQPQGRGDQGGRAQPCGRARVSPQGMPVRAVPTIRLQAGLALRLLPITRSQAMSPAIAELLGLAEPMPPITPEPKA